MVEVAAGVTAGLTVAAAWLDLRKRTNGKGPIAESVKELRADIADVKADVREVKAEMREFRQAGAADPGANA